MKAGKELNSTFSDNVQVTLWALTAPPADQVEKLIRESKSKGLSIRLYGPLPDVSGRSGRSSSMPIDLNDMQLKAIWGLRGSMPRDVLAEIALRAMPFTKLPIVHLMLKGE